MPSIIVTGDAELDKALAELEPKLQKKAIKKACRESAKKVVLPAVKASIRARAYDTGAMHDAVKVRATSRNIKQGTGITKAFTRRDGVAGTFEVKRIVAQHFGAKVEITRKELDKQRAKRGLPPARTVKGWYPAVVELGADGNEAQKPMRQVLPAARAPTLAIFRAELTNAINNIKLIGK